MEYLNEDLSKKNIRISEEEKKSETLLLNVLPQSIARRLKSGEIAIADKFEETSVVFIDIVEFTRQSAHVDPEKIVEVLNNIFTKFDQIAAKYGMEKIKTIGDCYMAAAGIPIPNKNHAESIARFSLDVLKHSDIFVLPGNDEGVQFRIGLDCGPAVAGVIGEQKFIYDLWGDTVNTASRMEEYGVTGKIQVSDRFMKTLEASHRIYNNEAMENKYEDIRFIFTERGEIEIKGKGMMKTWFLDAE